MSEANPTEAPSPVRIFVEPPASAPPQRPPLLLLSVDPPTSAALSDPTPQRLSTSANSTSSNSPSAPPEDFLRSPLSIPVLGPPRKGATGKAHQEMRERLRLASDLQAEFESQLSPVDLAFTTFNDPQNSANFIHSGRFSNGGGPSRLTRGASFIGSSEPTSPRKFHDKNQVGPLNERSDEESASASEGLGEDGIFSKTQAKSQMKREISPVFPADSFDPLTPSNAPVFPLKTVNEIQYHFDPFSLRFSHPDYEREFHQTNTKTFGQHFKRQQMGILLFLTVQFLLIGVQLDRDYYYEGFRLGMIGVSALFICLLFPLRHSARPFDFPCQLKAVALWTIAGILVAISSAIFNHKMDRSTEAASIIVFLFISHATGRALLYYMIAPATALISAVFIILAAVFRPVESSAFTIWQIFLVALACAAVNFFTYRLEELKRYNFITELRLEMSIRERNQVKKEAHDLRSEVYVMTLEKYDIGTLEGETMDFVSPIEQAMGFLQRICLDPSTPQKIFLDLQRVIGLLGSSEDVFRPKVSDVVSNNKNNRNLIDQDMERWLNALVYGAGEQAGAEEINKQEQQENEKMAAEAAAATLAGGVTNQSPAGSPVSLAEGYRVRRKSFFHHALLSQDESAVQKFLTAMDDWEFDTFDIVSVSNNRPLLFIGMALFKKYDLPSKFHIESEKLSNFLNSLEAGYYDGNPYHNATHAGDVARSVHFFLKKQIESGMNYTDIELFSLIVSALIHDLNHPGRTNQFHIISRHSLALFYNDRSVLENHHCSQAFFLLQKPENNIFSNVKAGDFTQIRKMIVDLVLATDLSMHFEAVSKFKQICLANSTHAVTGNTGASGAAASGGTSGPASSGGNENSPEKNLSPASTGASRYSIDFSNESHRLISCKLALKCADVAHAAKPLFQHLAWSERINEEFFRQGDLELKLGLPISAFMDRHKTNTAQSQLGFIDFLVSPMFEIWCSFLHIPECMENLHENRKYWEKKFQSSTAAKEKEKNNEEK